MRKFSPKLKISLFVSLSLIFVFGSFFVYGKQLVAPEGLTTIGQLFNSLEKFFLWIAIPLVALAVIAGGIVFLTSFGIPERINLGKTIMKYAGIGLIVVLFGVGLGQWLGEKQAEVVSFQPLSATEINAAKNYITFLEDLIAKYNSAAQKAEAEGKREIAKIAKQNAEELSNNLKPLRTVVGLLENSEKETTAAYNEYKSLSDAAKASQKINKDELNADYQKFVALKKQNSMYRQYLYNLGATIYAYGLPESADPDVVIVPAKWDGQSSLKPGDSIKINGGEFIWNGYYWQPKDKENYQKATSEKKNPQIEFANGVVKTYEFNQDLIWQEKDTKKIAPLNTHMVLLACGGGSCSTSTTPVYTEPAGGLPQGQGTWVTYGDYPVYGGDPTYNLWTPYGAATDYMNYGSEFGTYLGQTMPSDATMYDYRAVINNNYLLPTTHYYETTLGEVTSSGEPVPLLQTWSTGVNIAFGSIVGGTDVGKVNAGSFGDIVLRAHGVDNGQDDYNKNGGAATYGGGLTQADVDKSDAGRQYRIEQLEKAGLLKYYDNGTPDTIKDDTYYLKTQVGTVQTATGEALYIDPLKWKSDESYQDWVNTQLDPEKYPNGLADAWAFNPKDVWVDKDGNFYTPEEMEKLSGQTPSKEVELAVKRGDLDLTKPMEEAIKLQQRAYAVVVTEGIIPTSEQCNCKRCPPCTCSPAYPCVGGCCGSCSCPCTCFADDPWSLCPCGGSYKGEHENKDIADKFNEKLAENTKGMEHFNSLIQAEMSKKAEDRNIDTITAYRSEITNLKMERGDLAEEFQNQGGRFAEGKDTGWGDYTMDSKEAKRAAERALQSAKDLQTMLDEANKCLSNPVGQNGGGYMFDALSLWQFCKQSSTDFPDFSSIADEWVARNYCCDNDLRSP